MLGTAAAAVSVSVRQAHATADASSADSGGISLVLTCPGRGVLAITMTVPGTCSVTAPCLGQQNGDDRHGVRDRRAVHHGHDLVEPPDLSSEQLGLVGAFACRREIVRHVEVGGLVELVVAARGAAVAAGHHGLEEQRA